MMEQGPPQQTPYQQPVALPKNWLAESILVTIFCCQPFGIVGIVYAAIANSKLSTGDIPGAEQASREAARWTKLGFFIGLGFIVLMGLFYALVLAGIIMGSFPFPRDA